MPQQFDLIVVGGGCNGTGIARDAAMRGLSVLLLEKNDFSSGTTGASSGMIHGGPRYLFSDVHTTKLSSRDAGYIRSIAPHLCFRIPFLYPEIEEGSTVKKKIRLSLVEAYVEAYDRFSELKGGKKHTRLSREECLNLHPGINPKVIGAVTFDEWGIQTERLCIANALSARNYGAEIRNHTQVTEVLRDGNRVTGVVTLSELTGEERRFHSRILFNATGPWVPILCRMAGVEVKLRPAKGIHLVLDRRISDVAIVATCIDGREIFINPHENTTLLGTTDDDYYGNPDEIPVTEDEVEYLLQAMERSFPEIRKARVISTTRGIRPTLHEYGPSEDDLSRRHEIFDHEKRDSVSGFLSMAGGKLATFRKMAEEATDLICKKLKVKATCSTHLVPLPGGAKVTAPQELATRYQVHPYTVERLQSRHGSLSEEVLKPTLTDGKDRGIVCPCEPVTRAEIRHSIRNELAATLGDLRRRTRLGAGPCQGTECLLTALGLLCEEKGELPSHPDREIDDLRRELQESFEKRSVILKGSQLAQEEVLQWLYKGVFAL